MRAVGLGRPSLDEPDFAPAPARGSSWGLPLGKYPATWLWFGWFKRVPDPPSAALAESLPVFRRQLEIEIDHHAKRQHRSFAGAERWRWIGGVAGGLSTILIARFAGREQAWLIAILTWLASLSALYTINFALRDRSGYHYNYRVALQQMFVDAAAVEADLLKLREKRNELEIEMGKTFPQGSEPRVDR